MCRKNAALAGVLIALGAGLRLSLVLESWILRLLLGAALVAVGILRS